MSHLLTVDAHLGVAARLRYLDKGAELLPPSRSSFVLAADRRGTSGGSTAGLRTTVVANPQGTIAPRAMSTLVVQERHLWLCLLILGRRQSRFLKFLYPRLASSATQPVTWPSSSLPVHRSRLRRSNTSASAGSCCLHPSAGCSAQPCSSPRAAPCIHPAPEPHPQQPPKACRRARCKQAAPPILAPVYWR